MGPRTGTPMRLVSPAPVMVPPGAQRTQQAPQIYPPQPPQTGQPNIYSTQNGSSIAGKVSILPMFYIYILNLLLFLLAIVVKKMILLLKNKCLFCINS